MKLSVQKNRKGFMMERHYRDGVIDIKMTCTDSTMQFDKVFGNLSSETAEKINSIFQNATTAREIISKLEALRLF